MYKYNNNLNYDLNNKKHKWDYIPNVETYNKQGYLKAKQLHSKEKDI